MDHPLWPTIAAGILQGQSGDRELARQQLTDVWAVLGAQDHALRCIVAHHLADLQVDLRSELEWDQRALDAHGHIQDPELNPLGVPSAAAFLPSLHLNLGDGWLRAGDPGRARQHLDRARSAEAHLGQDGYGDLVRRGLKGLAGRIAATDNQTDRHLVLDPGKASSADADVGHADPAVGGKIIGHADREPS